MHIHQWLCKLISDSNDKYENNQLVSGWRGLQGTRSVGQCGPGWCGHWCGAAPCQVSHTAGREHPPIPQSAPACRPGHISRDTAWQHVTRDTRLVTWPASAPWPPAGGCSRVTAATAGGTTDPSPAATRQTCNRRWTRVWKDLHWQASQFCYMSQYPFIRS